MAIMYLILLKEIKSLENRASCMLERENSKVNQAIQLLIMLNNLLPELRLLNMPKI
jgi:hypothetical protein